MKSSIVNLCKDGGSGMSECTVAGLGHEKQCICSFYIVSSVGNRCRFEIMGEFCDRVAAQKHSKGQPILLSEVNNYADPETEPVPYRVVDTSGVLDKEIIDEASRTIEKMKRDKMLTFNIDRRFCYKDENGDFHVKDLDPLDDILDKRGLPYIDEVGNIQYAKPKNESAEEMKDPCTDCCHAYSEYGCEKCATKGMYELNKEQEEIAALRRHEFMHDVARVGNRLQKKSAEWYYYNEPNLVHNEQHNHNDDYYSNVTIQDRRVVDEMHKLSAWHRFPSTPFENNRFLMIRYIMSREISKAEIMERYSEDLMVVIPTSYVLTDTHSDHENLLLDTKYLILYTSTGEVALVETMEMLREKIPNWTNLVPQDALFGI